ncbi:Crp/Fnr family transcriptional regulator [Chryseobacterium gambrini]|jgi:CRP-like cAMP-binding protein|uniref:cAMP-binding domain of CRP or a regulatory subunit of cAMP-dependent protein kinases n=1 Tax=Chryseobacterium gambrini TaxID=373672 RepID=A0A1N7PMW4_9FLAO|nr:Crp/Fnr family transcriptional regulator [Chryseobacterium gambrini]MBL7879570.1 Crp/Fnr family transcriptional regulator [Chryseobacterium gambrini]WBV51002.1 Crp/Fnr family transcriptional regulator [Chryseobacterium gambrini]SIT11994.1 cAMP-binding domain of CRP or a regulatory subunit of cAMP-dependent protein kinases [Chryseobacterium gambrini]
MYNKFISYLNGLLASPLNPEEIKIIKEVFKPKTLLKNQYFLQQGEICKLTGFIVKGAIKQYSLDEKGKEKVLGLLIDNWWVGDRESMLKNIPSSYYIQAYQRSELLIFTKEDFEEHLINQPFILEARRILFERQSLQLLKRLYATNMLPAKQRIQELENCYPDFFQKFPQHLIASYLGLTKETYSRIKSNMLKNQ